MKRFFSALAGILFGAAMICGAADREHTLKIYNWADYIDEALLDEFKTWYKEQTGEDVEISSSMSTKSCSPKLSSATRISMSYALRNISSSACSVRIFFSR